MFKDVRWCYEDYEGKTWKRGRKLIPKELEALIIFGENETPCKIFSYFCGNCFLTKPNLLILRS